MMNSASKPKIRYGFRGEGIHYEMEGRRTEIQFTWVGGDRIYTETISRWDDGSAVSDTDKGKILKDLLLFTKGWFRKSIVVINTDDSSKILFEEVCSELPNLVKGIEYTSDEANRRFERGMYLGTLQSGAGLMIDNVLVESERQLDEGLASMREPRES